jgi:cytochrome c-type biogenesis protein CcmE
VRAGNGISAKPGLSNGAGPRLLPRQHGQRVPRRQSGELLESGADLNPKRKNRLIAVSFLVVGAAISVTFVLLALNDNINMFYPPDEVVSGGAPVDAQIRAGGMVQDGSVSRSTEGLEVSFVLTDLEDSHFTVIYSGLLPDLFREGQGVIVMGKLKEDGVFHADQVLAKHDENYMPPELAEMSPGHKSKPNPLNYDR